ncbi:MAG TPA: SRPBCC family protein [Thermoleophilia bacterium]|nr:SRPBCC family protein [Thermoleophilia bacterium]
MDINRTAPVTAKTQMQIAADRQTVWDALTDFETWPEWKRDVRSMSLRGPVAPGSTFEWKAGPGTIRSTLEEVDAPGRIAWTGSTFGIKAVDVFRLEARDGGTLVTEEESWEGLLARLFRSRMRRTLQSGIDQGIEALKAEAERRARQSAAA